MHKVVVVGAGYAGLAVCWHLLKHPFEIHLFSDESTPSASQVSTGLLHAFPGEHARKSSEADLALQESLELLDAASSFLGTAVYEKRGLFRPALFEEQRLSFQKTARQHPETQWQDDGLYIPEAFVVDSSRYLNGLLGLCKEKGMQHHKRKIERLEELDAFDHIVIAAGAECLRFFPHLPLGITKGQALLCRLSEARKKLPRILGGKGHICAHGEDLCLIGSTYERGYKSEAPDLARAGELKELVAAFFPEARDLEVVDCKAALRVAKKGSYLPLVQQTSERVWVYTGLGSRGLLYHALFAKRVVEGIL